MSVDHLTVKFIVTQVAPDSALEIWVDWLPAVDGDPKAPRCAHRDGNDLVVAPREPDGSTRPRRVQGLDPELWPELTHGLIWRVCGPSGVLAEHRIALD